MPTPRTTRNFPSQRLFLVGVLIASGLLVAWAIAYEGREKKPRSKSARGKEHASQHKLEDIPFDGESAYESLKKICDLGPRKSGSKGMQEQRDILTLHFQEQGGKVELQKFTARDPSTGHNVEMANLIARWRIEKKQRLMLAAHYDTRPFPDSDPVNPRGKFVGANDGASGVAVLMELSKHLNDLSEHWGIDLVLFDGEELVYRDSDPFFLGSRHFAQEYVDNLPAIRYRWAVLLDMVGDRDLQIYQERNSLSWKDSKPLVLKLWGIANRLGVKEFIAEPKHEVRDDHLALHDIAKIPSCDLIDFDYPDVYLDTEKYWHTEADTADKCSALSLAKVGWVVLEWLKSL